MVKLLRSDHSRRWPDDTTQAPVKCLRFHSSIKLQWEINNAAVKLVSTKRKIKKEKKEERGGREKREVKIEKKLVKITALPPPHLCLGEPRFQNSSFLDNYPTVQPVLNLWSSPFKESSYRMNARPRRNNILYTTKAAPGTATALPLPTPHPPLGNLRPHHPLSLSRLLSRRRYLAPIQNWLFYFLPSPPLPFFSRSFLSQLRFPIDNERALRGPN